MKKFLLTVTLLLLILCCAAVCHAESHSCSGGTATCEKLAVCATCGKTYGHLTDHAWGNWVSDNDATHTRTCQYNASHKETRYHSGGASSCTQGAKCVYCGAVHEEPLGHVPSVYAGYAATCISAGATDGEVCSRCGDTLTPRRVINAKGHSYSTWEPMPGDQHMAVCTMSTCGAAGMMPCTPCTVTLGDTTHTVCPICGVNGEFVFPTLIARMDDAVPMGQLLVRGLTDSCGALYALTVAGSYAGNVVELDAPASVILMDDLSFLPAFTLMRVDIAEDGTQALTEIPCRMVDGHLNFSAEKAGLYLLMPAE